MSKQEKPKSDLANRQRVNLVLANEVIEGLRTWSKGTDVPMSKIANNAIAAIYGDQF